MKRGTLHRKVSGWETIYNTKVRDTRIEYKDEFKKGHLNLKEECDTGERRD